MRRWMLAGLTGALLVMTSATPQGQPRSMLVGATLTGAAENPPTATGTVGKVLCTVTDAEIKCRVDTWNAQTARTASHIHVGPVGINGPTVCDSTPVRVAGDHGYNFTCTAGNLIPRRAVGIDTFAQFVNTVVSCGAYFNEHTELFPSGDVRGQLIPLSDNPFTGINSCSGLGNK